MTQSEIIPNLLDAIPQHININIMTFLPSRLGNQGCFIAVPAMGVVRGSQTEQHKNRICVWRNVNCMLETLHEGIGPNEKIKGNCSLYLLHTWMQWRKINTKPPYELSFGWAVDKHWSAVLSAALWERFGRTGLSLLDRCRCIMNSETSHPPLHYWYFMFIHESTEKWGESITLGKPLHVPGQGHFQAVYISVLLFL